MSTTGSGMIEEAARQRWMRGELSEVERREAEKYRLTAEEAAAALLCQMSFADYDRMRWVGDIRSYKRRKSEQAQGGAK